MQISDIVYDLKYAKELKELGVEQDSLFYYSYPKDSLEDWQILTKEEKEDMSNLYEFMSAFTSDELLELLPNNFESKYGTEFLNMFPLDKCFEVEYIDNNKIKYHHVFDKKLSNALAQMLIYLIKEKIIEIKKEVNKL